MVDKTLHGCSVAGLQSADLGEQKRLGILVRSVFVRHFVHRLPPGALSSQRAAGSTSPGDPSRIPTPFFRHPAEVPQDHKSKNLAKPPPPPIFEATRVTG